MPSDVLRNPLFCIYIDCSLLQKILGRFYHQITRLHFFPGYIKKGNRMRSFYVAAPTLWNAFPDDVKSADCNDILLSRQYLPPQAWNAKSIVTTSYQMIQ